MMNKNKVIDYGGNGLKFEINGDDRPRIQDLDDDQFAIYGLEEGNAYIHKNDIDDLIILLQELKAHNYKIDYK